MNWSGFRLDDPFLTENPFVSFKRLQEEMNRLFNFSESESDTFSRGDFGKPFDFRRSLGTYPPLNLWVGDEGAIITVEVPGVDPKSIDLSVLGNTLTIKGERSREELSDEARVVRRERGDGSFVRSLELPFAVESSKVDAECRNGLLTVRVPRAEEEKPRRISVR